MDAREAYRGSEAEKKFSQKSILPTRFAISSASGWSSIFAMRWGSSYDVVKAVLAAGADDVVDAVHGQKL